ncbi:flagellar biosynthesis anti-sigma factor FlgM [Alteromonas macleodii]|uniref:flagellar biosynthesis anti-sigma factor FlgM n=1 Tax=Alteromonas macleodii TaxID=28108 RepID=UPI003140099E
MDIKRVSTPSQFVDLKAKGAKEKQTTQDAPKTSASDSIDLAHTTMGETSFINVARVEELKEKIENGSYEFNLEGIAKAITDLDG